VADEPQSAKGGGGAGWLAGCGIVAGANLGCFLPLMLAAFFFVGYMSVNGLTPEGDSGTGAAGPISETIPESLRPVFEKAGAAHGVPPNLIAAIFGYGEHCQKRSADRATCLTPGFPTQGPWASNKTTNASGPFQFMECTWEGQQPVCDRIGRGDGTFSSDPAFIKSTSGKSAGMGEDCDGDGRADVQKGKRCGLFLQPRRLVRREREEGLRKPLRWIPVKRVGLIAAAIFILALSGLIAWTAYSSAREAGPRKTASHFIEVVSTYDTSTSLDTKIDEIERLFVEDKFTQEFDASAYAKGLVTSQEVGISQRVEIRSLKVRDLRETSAVVIVSSTLISASPDGESRSQFEQTVHLKRVGSDWRVDDYEERSL
jgi:hypothetical protein